MDLNSAIVTALRSLDPADDSHWIADGRPALEVLATIIGEKVSRAQIREAMPGFRRPAMESSVVPEHPAAAAPTGSAPAAAGGDDGQLSSAQATPAATPAVPRPTLKELDNEIQTATQLVVQAQKRLSDAISARDAFVSETTKTETLMEKLRAAREQSKVDARLFAEKVRALSSISPGQSVLDRALSARVRPGMKRPVYLK